MPPLSEGQCWRRVLPNPGRWPRNPAVKRNPADSPRCPASRPRREWRRVPRPDASPYSCWCSAPYRSARCAWVSAAGVWAEEPVSAGLRWEVAEQVWDPGTRGGGVIGQLHLHCAALLHVSVLALQDLGLEDVAQVLDHQLAVAVHRDLALAVDAAARFWLCFCRSRPFGEDVAHAQHTTRLHLDELESVCRLAVGWFDRQHDPGRLSHQAAEDALGDAGQHGAGLPEDIQTHTVFLDSTLHLSNYNQFLTFIKSKLSLFTFKILGPDSWKS